MCLRVFIDNRIGRTSNLVILAGVVCNCRCTKCGKVKVGSCPFGSFTFGESFAFVGSYCNNLRCTELSHAKVDSSRSVSNNLLSDFYRCLVEAEYRTGSVFDYKRTFLAFSLVCGNNPTYDFVNFSISCACCNYVSNGSSCHRLYCNFVSEGLSCFAASKYCGKSNFDATCVGYGKCSNSILNNAVFAVGSPSNAYRVVLCTFCCQRQLISVERNSLVNIEQIVLKSNLFGVCSVGFLYIGDRFYANGINLVLLAEYTDNTFYRCSVTHSKLFKQCLVFVIGDEVNVGVNVVFHFLVADCEIVVLAVYVLHGN